jgi:hypothetical protein
MKKYRPLQIILVLGVVAAFLLSAAAPLPVRLMESVAAKSDLIKLTVDNRSSGNLYVWLEGPAFYYFQVNSEDLEVFAIARGDYTYKFRACGDTVTGEINLNSQRKLIMPVCGGRAFHESEASDPAADFDISSEIKIVEVSVENDSNSKLFVIMTGPTTYVFTFAVDAEQEYTIAKGDYKVQVWGCGRYGIRNFSAFKGKTLVLECPKL